MILLSDFNFFVIVRSRSAAFSDRLYGILGYTSLTQPTVLRGFEFMGVRSILEIASLSYNYVKQKLNFISENPKY
ncbi:hypothetical protein ACN4EE_17770 [Geminocystis sp. CENA526]|uniref:hypothetical protein n=1 Tax=Geminocystis sp. CENA526 TaxID=1355871 RepID=UPI003D6E48DE